MLFLASGSEGRLLADEHRSDVSLLGHNNFTDPNPAPDFQEVTAVSRTFTYAFARTTDRSTKEIAVPWFLKYVMYTAAPLHVNKPLLVENSQLYFGPAHS